MYVLNHMFLRVQARISPTTSSKGTTYKTTSWKEKHVLWLPSYNQYDLS